MKLPSIAKSLAVCASVLLVAPPASAQSASTVKWPETASTRLVRAWLDAVGDGTDTVLRRFATTYAETPDDKQAVEETVVRLRGMNERTGGATAIAVDSASDQVVVVRVATKKAGANYTLRFVLGTRADGKPFIDGINMALTPP